MKDLPKLKGTILIVDDDPNVLWFMSRVFQPMGYGTLTAQSGSEALKYFQGCGAQIDVMIVDLRLPGIDGADLVRSVRVFRPDLPVIVISGFPNRKEECEKLGIEAFLQKPYSLEDLYACVESIIERRVSDKEEAVLGPDVELSAKILIVDDEPEVGMLLCESLMEDFPEGNFKIKGAATGQEALRVAREFEPDIAIIDIKMPGMAGDELIQRFKSGESYCPRDFVIHTGVTDPEVVARAKSLGHRVLTKPTDLDTLFVTLKRICIRHHLVRKKEHA
ncbi:MAG: response regulator [Candidatus Omnitrophica bacterium]|nr:response regulator [Candidatus Omnitrophota bacterium]